MTKDLKAVICLLVAAITVSVIVLVVLFNQIATMQAAM